MVRRRPPSSASPLSTRKAARLRAAAVLIFIAVSLANVVLGGGERSGWISLSQPFGADHRAFSLLGYCFLHGGEPFMKENIPHVSQVGLFNGALDDVKQSEYREDFRFIRGLHSFLGSLLTPPLDVISALLVVNWRAGERASGRRGD